MKKHVEFSASDGWSEEYEIDEDGIKSRLVYLQREVLHQ